MWHCVPEQKTAQTAGHPHEFSHCPRSGTALAASDCYTGTALDVPACTELQYAYGISSETSASSLSAKDVGNINGESLLLDAHHNMCTLLVVASLKMP